MHVYPSEMAQNFWTAIYAWTTCFLITIIVSLLTRAHEEKELAGLVYSLTERPTQHDLSWYQRPAVLAVVVLVATALLNIIFR
jgi:SSS family solute:Na+ symporter